MIELTSPWDADNLAHGSLRHADGGFPLFDAVIKALPAGTIIQGAVDHGDCCSWFRIGRIQAKDKLGNDVQFFVKYAIGATGRNMLRSEFQAQCKLYSLIPNHVPKPMTWGSVPLRSPNECSYLITEFVPFVSRVLPDLDAAGSLVAKLHAVSRGTSDRFGTSGPLFDGMLCYLSGWESKWQTLFAKMLYQVYHYNTLSNGGWDTMHAAIVPIITHVVPRLLGALEKDGRTIVPCFIHGDLWNGNFGTTADTDTLYLFDSSGYYAHHEMEFALWRTRHHRMHEQDYCSSYFNHHPRSEPVDEFDDRLLLYTLKPCLVYSSMNPGHVTRQRALDNMAYLLQKYHYQPPESSDQVGGEVFREIADGQHLWQKEYPLDVACFIEARKKR
ncbi:Fructosamine kinase-domain-containing protein [Ilyonectria sp. MPI-CAGE-AT-0026]|nr:Fructosamine kinase-domain-containing protein [Ilyonectria sp. MPI-CAGE-AT-0026]